MEKEFLNSIHNISAEVAQKGRLTSSGFNNVYDELLYAYLAEKDLSQKEFIWCLYLANYHNSRALYHFNNENYPDAERYLGEARKNLQEAKGVGR